MNKNELLQTLGLSKTEAELYLVSLQLGPSSAIQLGQKLNLTRQLIYSLLPRLTEQSLIKQVTIGKRHFYQAVGPEVLRDKIKALQKEVEAIIPLLKEQHALNQAVPLIILYDNPLSMREWYREFMKKAKRGEEQLVYSTELGWYDLDQEFYDKYVRFQKKKDIRMQIITPDNPETRALAKKVSIREDQYRFTSEGWIGENAKWIWRDQIVYLTIRGKATNMIVVESHEMAEIERFAFRRVWESLKPTKNYSP